MLPKNLQGLWSVERLSDFVVKWKSGHEKEVLDDLIHLLNMLQNTTLERVKKIETLPRAGGMLVTFGDDSGVTLLGPAADKFLTEYIASREAYITIMEANRKEDPRLTGQLARLLEEVRLLREEHQRYKDTHPPL